MLEQVDHIRMVDKLTKSNESNEDGDDCNVDEAVFDDLNTTYSFPPHNKIHRYLQSSDVGVSV